MQQGQYRQQAGCKPYLYIPGNSHRKIKRGMAKGSGSSYPQHRRAKVYWVSMPRCKTTASTATLFASLVWFSERWTNNASRENPHFWKKSQISFFFHRKRFEIKNIILERENNMCRVFKKKIYYKSIDIDILHTLFIQIK